MGDYRTEFPDFGELDIRIPADFKDVSDSQGFCPKFECAEQDLLLVIDYADHTKREVEGFARFSLHSRAGSGWHEVVATDNWTEMQAAIAINRFRDGFRAGKPLPPHTNRSVWASNALRTFVNDAWCGRVDPGEVGTAIGDLMVNLCHLAADAGVDPAPVLGKVMDRFRVEVVEDAST